MYFRWLRLFLLAGLMAQPLTAAYALNPVNWEVVLSSSGEDVFWTSPTAVTTGLPEYDWSYEVTKLNANVLVLGNHSLLGLLGDLAAGGGTEMGLPFLVVDEVLADDTTGSSAHIRIEVDADGFGRASATDITLGAVLGLPIRRVDFEASVFVVGVPLGDYDRDGAVDLVDYELWRAAFGSTTIVDADGNRNGIVDAADYTVWRDNVGLGATSSSAAATVPEPGGAFLLAAPLAVVALSRKRREAERQAMRSSRIAPHLRTWANWVGSSRASRRSTR